MIRFAAMLLFAVTTSAAPLAAQEAVTLRYKFDSKTPLNYRSVSTVEQTQTVMGKDYKNVFKTTEVHQYRLSRVGQDKEFELERENKALAANIKIAQLGSDYKFDSKADSNEKGSAIGSAMTPVYETLYGAILKITLSPRGEVKSVKGLAELLAPVLKDNPIAKQFVGGGTDQSATLGEKMTFPVFSTIPVKPGDSWSIPFKMPIPKIGAVDGKKVYKFAGIETVKGRKLAKVTFQTEMTVKIDLTVGGAKVTGETSVDKSSGTLMFDIAKGQIVTKKESYTVVGDLTVSANGMDIGVKTKQKQSSSLEQLDKLPE